MRTCVIFPGALGDFICFLPALKALAADTSIDLFAQSQFAEIAPEGVAVRSLERPEIAQLFVSGAQEDPRLKSFFRGYGAVYSWLGSSNEQYAACLQALAGGRARLFSFRPATPQGHQADYYLACLNRPGVVSAEPRIAPQPEANRWCDGFWAKHAFRLQPVLAVAPGSGALEKNWPMDFFISVARWWGAATAGATIFLVGPAEKERGGIEPLLSDFVVAGDLRLSQVAALLSRCTVYLGNDSGISHLAGALGVRTVTLFGPSDERQWAPRGDRVTVARRNLACSPCREPTMKSCLHRACLRELPAGEIIAILRELPEVVTLTRYGAKITV